MNELKVKETLLSMQVQSANKEELVRLEDVFIAPSQPDTDEEVFVDNLLYLCDDYGLMNLIQSFDEDGNPKEGCYVVGLYNKTYEPQGGGGGSLWDKNEFEGYLTEVVNVGGKYYESTERGLEVYVLRSVFDYVVGIFETEEEQA